MNASSKDIIGAASGQRHPKRTSDPAGWPVVFVSDGVTAACQSRFSDLGRRFRSSGQLLPELFLGAFVDFSDRISGRLAARPGLDQGFIAIL
jgi:hypothetical protein